MITRKKSDKQSGTSSSAGSKTSEEPKRLLTPERAMYWCKMPSWTLKEATLLAKGIDPSLINTRTFRNPVRKVRIVNTKTLVRPSLADIAERAVLAGELKENPTPVSFIAWLKSEDINFSRVLDDCVASKISLKSKDADSQSSICEYVGVNLSVEELRSRIFDLERKLASAEEQFADEILHPRFRSNFQMMIVALAIDKFQWRPDKNNSAATNMKKCLDDFGLELSDETILERIKEAYNRHKELLDSWFALKKDDYKTPTKPLEVKSSNKYAKKP